MNFRFNANDDQIDDLAWSLKFESGFQTGMPNLDGLVSNRNIGPHQHINIFAEQLLIMLGDLPFWFGSCCSQCSFPSKRQKERHHWQSRQVGACRDCLPVTNLAAHPTLGM